MALHLRLLSFPLCSSLIFYEDRFLSSVKKLPPHSEDADRSDFILRRALSFLLEGSAASMSCINKDAKKRKQEKS